MKRSIARWLLNFFGETIAEDKLRTQFRLGKESGRREAMGSDCYHYWTATPPPPTRPLWLEQMSPEPEPEPPQQQTEPIQTKQTPLPLAGGPTLAVRRPGEFASVATGRPFRKIALHVAPTTQELHAQSWLNGQEGGAR